MKTFTYKSEFSDFIVEYAYHFGFAGIFGGPPDGWEPPEPDEISIIYFKCGGIPYIADGQELSALDDATYLVLEEICAKDFLENHAEEMAE